MSPRFADIGIQVDIQHDRTAEATRTLPKVVATLGRNSDKLSMERHMGLGKGATTCVTPHQFKQVGLVRVSVEILALSQEYQTQGGSDDQYEDGLEEADHAQDIETGVGDPRPTNNEAVGPSKLNQASGNHTNTNGRNRKRGEDEEDEYDGNKRTCRRPPETQQKMNLPRLACPYQAHERNQVCLRPGRSNPEGGCAGIGRLKLVKRNITFEIAVSLD